MPHLAAQQPPHERFSERTCTSGDENTLALEKVH
jgi:hypothetical protein